MKRLAAAFSVLALAGLLVFSCGETEDGSGSDAATDKGEGKEKGSGGVVDDRNELGDFVIVPIVAMPGAAAATEVGLPAAGATVSVPILPLP